MNDLLRLGILWISGTAVFTVLDLIWIGVVAAPIYRSQLGDMLTMGGGMTGGRVVAALLTWMVIIFGLLCFALPRAVQAGGAISAFLWGALLGFVIYAVYDLTNLAVLRGWTVGVTVLDIAWGTFACGLVNLILYGLDKGLLHRGPLA